MLSEHKLEAVLELLLPVIQLAESCKLTAYTCPAGIWTCGWGATGAGIGPGVIWTQEKADTELRTMAIQAITQVVTASPTLLAESPIRIAALVDFVYNLGIGNYNSSTLKKCVDRGDWEKAKVEIVRWDKGGGRVLAGLTKRRAAEAKMLT